MIKTNQMLARLSLLATTLPSVVLAQVINRPSNDRPAEGGGGNTVYIIVAVVVVAVAAFLFFRGKKKD
jgi:LPXTG-motif cell wall-anchored protein